MGITLTSPLVTAGKWAFAGRGWASRGEQYLAAYRASQAAEARRLAADADAATHALAALLAPLLHRPDAAAGPGGGGDPTAERASQPDATMGPGT